MPTNQNVSRLNVIGIRITLAVLKYCSKTTQNSRSDVTSFIAIRFQALKNPTEFLDEDSEWEVNEHYITVKQKFDSLKVACC